MPRIITIDGPAGSGKSTVAKKLAVALTLPYLDTGAMYRWVAYRALQENLSLDDENALVELADRYEFSFPFKDGNFEVRVTNSKGPERVLGPEIRTPEVSMGSSQIARLKNLRACLVKKQQEIGRRLGGVAEGRDAGTVIFPDSKTKFFLLATPEVRAKRRHLELVAKMGESAPSFENVLKEVNLRDAQDGGRAASPMVPAKDAQIIDSSGLSIEEVYRVLLSKIESC